MTKHTHITVVGSQPLDFDLTVCKRLGPMIVAGNSHKNTVFEYATANSEQHVQDMLNSPSFRDTRIVVNERLYKKYIFFDPLDCVPNFPAVNSMDLSSSELSEQSLALLLACWLDIETILLLGYDIENLTERARLLSIGSAHPHNKIVYVRKPNPNKIFLFDKYPNMSVTDYKKLSEMNKRG